MSAAGVIDRSGLAALIAALHGDGYTVIGPTLRGDAITYDVIGGVDDLPEGWTDQQGPGSYTVQRREDSRLFGYALGPRSWKAYLAPERSVVWSATKGEYGWAEHPPEPPPRYAFIGVRGCEIAAMGIQDRVFMGAAPDPGYTVRRRTAFIVAVNCDEPAANCFCEPMGTGPGVDHGFDIALTELDGAPRMLVEAGSERGAAMLAAIGDLTPATPADEATAAERVAAAAAVMRGRFDTADIHDLLLGNLDHPHWDEVAERCLGCTNCTLVCPTCFCSTIEDGVSLDGTEATRTRRWDSCFTMDFSYIHGGPVRPSRPTRYRQWLTHKLATWIDQFGTSGCVGCGRCVTWCPVGIDLRQEVEAIRRSDRRRPAESALPSPERLS